uniref:Uncharacterized protein n=1 Tax=Kalanchoe fedtschenkoi TaxID=63787 RepID=A0A7N0UJI8_KALFE
MIHINIFSHHLSLSYLFAPLHLPYSFLFLTQKKIFLIKLPSKLSDGSGSFERCQLLSRSISHHFLLLVHRNIVSPEEVSHGIDSSEIQSDLQQSSRSAD